MRFIGPLGHLSPPPNRRPVVLVAQGIGISAARSILRQPDTVSRTLIHVGDHHLRDETRALADSAFYPEHRAAFREILTATVVEQPDADFLLSGSRTVVGDIAASLRLAGVAGARIRRDPFYGLRDRTFQLTATPGTVAT